eukprot:2956671-Amphidinium_carterae.1
MGFDTIGPLRRSPQEQPREGHELRLGGDKNLSNVTVDYHEDLKEEARERDEVASVSPEDPPWRTLEASAAAGKDEHKEVPQRVTPILCWGVSGQDADQEQHPDDPSNHGQRGCPRGYQAAPLPGFKQLPAPVD